MKKKQSIYTDNDKIITFQFWRKLYRNDEKGVK